MYEHARKKKRKPKAVKVPGELRQVFATNVRELMELRFAKHGDKVKVLATKAAVSRSTMQRVLNAQHGTNVDTIDTIAEALGVPAFQLLAKRKR